jgi:hypothetical protein
LKHLDGYAGPENTGIRDFLIRIGGRNPAGYPMFRLVDSEKVIEKMGGNWKDWDESLSVEERSPTVRKTFTVMEEATMPNGEVTEVAKEKSLILPGNAPIREVNEVREVPKYSHLDTQGWILEKFYPAYMFGSREEWASYVVPGTEIPRLGPYPADGRYEMVAGIFPAPPAHSFLEDFIAYHAKRAQEMQERDVRSYVNDAVHRAEEEDARKTEDARLHILDKIKPLLGTSLEAGRWRNEVARQAGIHSHMGN